jgi:hypothetical protein
MPYDLTVSIVTYETDQQVLKDAIAGVLHSRLRVSLYLIDNSRTDAARSLYNDSRIIYIFNGANIGFAAGHNIAIKKNLHCSPYHLVLNPDVYFEQGTLEKLFEFMESHRDVGLIMPRVLYPDGSIQFLCKLLPTPFDLLTRRFLPTAKVLTRRTELYELRFTGYDTIMDVPYLSGCFMFLRTDALRRVGVFDERFTLYLEDADLSRRIHRHYRTVYYPEVSIFHQYEKGSYKNARLLRYHLRSALRYFNKWGYIFDRERHNVNRQILQKLMPRT